MRVCMHVPVLLREIYCYVDFFLKKKLLWLGSLVGLGLRTGASFQLQLPPLFYRIIAGCPDLDPPSSGQGLSATREKDISKAAALAIRHGIVSVFPEVNIVFAT